MTALRSTGGTVATAESLTGGLVCSALTEAPGASEVVRGGLVAYLPEVKEESLGVPGDLIAEHGVVSAPCALAMADGARDRLGADWAVATTGVAGPASSEGKPPGTVFVAWSGPRDAAAPEPQTDGEEPGSGGREHTRGVLALHLHGSRAEIRAATVEAVLDALTEAILGHDRASECANSSPDVGESGYGGESAHEDSPRDEATDQTGSTTRGQ